MDGGGERGEQGTETAGRLDDREGDLGSGTGRGRRESRSGRRLGNIAVLPPPWLINIYITTLLLSIDLVKIKQS